MLTAEQGWCVVQACVTQVTVVMTHNANRVCFAWTIFAILVSRIRIVRVASAVTAFVLQMIQNAVTTLIVAAEWSVTFTRV